MLVTLSMSRLSGSTKTTWQKTKVMLRKLYFPIIRCLNKWMWSSVFACCGERKEESKTMTWKKKNRPKWKCSLSGTGWRESETEKFRIRISEKKRSVERQKRNSTQLGSVRDGFIYYPFSIWFHSFDHRNICCCQSKSDRMIRPGFSYVCHCPFNPFGNFLSISFAHASLGYSSAVVISLFVEFMSWFTLPVTPVHNLSSNIFFVTQFIEQPQHTKCAPKKM